MAQQVFIERGSRAAHVHLRRNNRHREPKINSKHRSKHVSSAKICARRDSVRFNRRAAPSPHGCTLGRPESDAQDEWRQVQEWERRPTNGDFGLEWTGRGGWCDKTERSRRGRDFDACRRKRHCKVATVAASLLLGQCRPAAAVAFFGLTATSTVHPRRKSAHQQSRDQHNQPHGAA